MKKFILKSSQIVAIIIATYGLLGFFADGYTDPFYLRFTSPKQHSLILGTSRAAQGIRPNVLDTLLKKRNEKLPIFNFSLTLLDSPYGETYYRAIQAKLDKNTKHGLFVVAIDPWSISSRSDFNDEIETKEVLSKITYFNQNPNYDYLINAYNKPIFSVIIDKFKKKSPLLLHENGWLEVSVPMDKKSIETRAEDKLKQYKQNLSIYKISPSRINWLEKTISLLKKHGNVVLVRIPVGEQILSLEKELYKPFDSLIAATFKNTPYLNFVEEGNTYQFVDGNHLYKESAKRFSIELAKKINKLFFYE